MALVQNIHPISQLLTVDLIQLWPEINVDMQGLSSGQTVPLQSYSCKQASWPRPVLTVYFPLDLSRLVLLRYRISSAVEACSNNKRT